MHPLRTPRGKVQNAFSVPAIWRWEWQLLTESPRNLVLYTYSNQAPRRRQNSTTSTSLYLGSAERRMSESWTETSETSKHRILMKLDRFWNFMSAILDPVYGILKIQFKIRNQRPRKPPSSELCENRAFKISCPSYWIRHFEKWKSDVKFLISDLKSPGVRSSTKIVGFHNYRPQKLLSRGFPGNHVVSKISFPTYWISAILRRLWLFKKDETIFFLQFNYSNHRWS